MRAFVVGAVLLLAGASAARAAEPANAPPAPEALAKVYACAATTDDAARLKCFDDAVAGLHQAQTSGKFAAIDAEGSLKIQREAFGFSLPSLDKLHLPFVGGDDGQTDEVSLTIKAVTDASNPTFTMTNGQVWASIVPLENRRAKAGATVTIRRAALGSYMMSFGGGAAARVKRIN